MNGEELFELLNIVTSSDLDDLHPEDLLHCFYIGNAMVFCSIADHACLRFQKIGNLMIASVDGDELVHEVKEQLVLPSDFYRYTTEYFRIMKESRHPGKNKF